MTKIFRDLTRKFVGLNIKKSVLTTKMRVFDHKNMYLTMKLEPVLTTKIVDNFVRFGMPYRLSQQIGSVPIPVPDWEQGSITMWSWNEANLL